MTRHRAVLCGLMLSFAACSSGPENPYTSLTTVGSLATTNSSFEADGDTTGEAGDGDGDPTTGDGDGDGDTGDGDGDPTTGDGDGDGDPGDGDGDAGDGDGDPTTTGDGDGDQQMTCGWNAGGNPIGYYCGFTGEDPDGIEPIDCPPGLVDGEPCGEITGVGCCDVNGDNWYCAGGSLLLEPCS